MLTTKKKSSSWFILSAGILAFVILATFFLHIYNGMIDKKNVTVQAEIDVKTKEINELKADPRIQVATLLDNNKATLDKMTELSQIPYFIDKVSSISGEYGLGLQWFNYSNGNIRLSSMIDGWLWTQSYKKVINFIDWYRNEEDADFTLWFINSVKTDDDIEFEVSLEVNNWILKKIEQENERNNVLDKIKKR